MLDESFTPHGKHLIAGEWVAGDATFASEPAHGPAHQYSVGSPSLVARAREAAEEAIWSYGYSTREERAILLEAIADEIEARADAITEIGTQETGLPEARPAGRAPSDRRPAAAVRIALPRRRLSRPAARRGAARPPAAAAPGSENGAATDQPGGGFRRLERSRAFSVAGGDTASALAAGCPVVVKGHSAHPGTGEIVDEAIHAAIRKCSMHPGTFSLIQGGKRDVGQAMVQHPLIRAVGFTGSLGGGRALFDLCAQRPEPIPFFGVLGLVNPMFLLPGAAKARGAQIGEGWASSLTMGAGQFCTNPGIAVVQSGAEGDSFVRAAAEALKDTAPQCMLTDGIAQAYRAGKERFDARNAVRPVLVTDSEGRNANPNLYQTDASDYLQDHALGEEVFGPLGLVVRVSGADEMERLAQGFEGQLTVTVHMDDSDTVLARRLMPVLERKAGRVLANGFPTGVEVADATVRGGPYPASTNFAATSVGTLAIRRFLRPVCYQNMPEALLPGDLA